MAVFTTAAVAGALSAVGIQSAFLATVSTFALNAAVGVGLSLAVAELQKADQPQAGGVQGKMQSGGDVPRSILMGARATAGSLVYANTWGKSGKTPNAYLTQVIALSDVPISGVTAVWVNGAPVTVDTSDTSYGDWGFPVEEYSTSGGGNNMWVKFHDGTQTEADPFLVNTVSSSSRPYENTRVGRGVAYAVVTSQTKEGLFSGFPSFRFEIAGMPLYDLTKDSTAGGTGSHRLNDQSTWGGDGDNLLAVQIYNLLHGISYDGVWLYGLQNLSSARLPAADWIQQINKCRASVEGPDGPEQEYQTGIEITVNTELGSTIEALLKGGQGNLIETGGTYKVRIGAPGASVLTISDGDILSTEPQTFTPFTTLANSINGITATYPEPKEAWNKKAAPPLYNSDYEQRDGNRRLIADLSLDVVSRYSQVQRIIKAALAEARRERRHTIVLPPWAWPLEPGDIITLSSMRNSYSSKLFRVDGVADKANLDVMLDITEVDPSDYDPPTTYTPPIFSPLDPLYPPVSVIDGWTVEPWTITDAVGAGRRPAMKVHAADDLNDVLSVHIVARVKATGAIVFDSAATPYAAPFAWVLSGNWCLPNTIYQVRGKERPYSGRVTEWSEWLDVLTPNILLGDGDVYLPGMVEGLQNFVGDATMWIRDGVRQTILDVQRLSRLSLDQDFTAFRDRQTIRQEVASTTGNNKAFFLEQIDVATGPNSALSRRMSIAEATLPGINANARALDLLSARVTNVDGKTDILSQSLIDLSAIVADKVGATAFSALTARVTTEEGKSTSQAASIIDLQTQINGKAAASAVSLLQTQVTTVETTANSKALVYRQTTAPTGTGVSLRDLWLKSNEGNRVYICTATGATPTWTLSEDQRIPQLVTDVQATADAITAISAGQTTGNLATANFRMGVSAGPAGYSSRIAMEARTGGAGSWRSAGLFIDVPASTGTPTRIVLQADQIAMTNGATVKNPFVFEGSVLYVDELTVRQANIINLMVTTSNIAPGAVSAADSAEVAGGSFSSGNKDATVTIAHGSGSPTVIIMGSSGGVAHPTGTGGSMSISARAGATTLNTSFNAADPGKRMSASVMGRHIPASGTTSTTFSIRASFSGTTSVDETNIVAFVLKR